jgi:GT2 family glycosyltransferase
VRSVTIFICTHNRAELLERTLASLNAATRPQDWAVEILVVANACTDATHAFLENYVRQQTGSDGRLPLRWVVESAPGKSNALNHGMPLVTSDLVAFVDDDHRVDRSYLFHVCKAAEDYPEADIFCGRILPDWEGTEPEWVHDAGPYRIYPLPVPRFDQGDAPRRLTPDIATPGGGNLFLRSEWLAKTGPFVVDMGPVGHDLEGGEDLEWVLRAQNLGARLQYVPQVVQYHYVDARRLTLPYLMKKAYVRTASTTRLGNPEKPAGVPRYLYRKLAEYLVGVLTAFGSTRRRFYLVRSAAALGEIAGHRQSKYTHRSEPVPHGRDSDAPDA